MPAFPQVIDSSYQLATGQAAIQRTVNWFLVPNEAPETEGKYKFLALPCPGNAAFCALPVPAPFNQPNRGLLELRGRCFGVNGDQVFEIDSTGAFIAIGNVVNDGAPCVMYANGNGQIFIGAGTLGTGEGYVIPAGAGVGSLISLQTNPDYLGCVSGTFQDGYALNVIPNSNAFQWGGDDDHVVGQLEYWNSANKKILAGQADYLRAIKSWREYVYIMGQRRSQVYQDVGSNGIGGDPFSSYNQTFIETGIAAAAAFVELEDSLLWIGEDSRGQRACWRSAAFQPQRVSNFGVERWWQSYTRVDDAIGFPYIWQGHQFVQFTFPNAGFTAGGDVVSATWLYDLTASALVGRPIWTERSYMVPGSGLQSATGIAPGRAEVSHAFCFGKHLVGSNGIDGNPGAIYQMAEGVYTDCGADPISGDQITQPIICDRITPHGPTWGKRSVHNRVEFELARGIGNSVDPGSDPQLLLRWSNDGGMTFGTEYSLSMGLKGQYNIWVYLLQLGYANHPGRVYWVRCADPVFNTLMNCNLDYFDLAS